MRAVLHTEEKREAWPIDRDSQSHVPQQLESFAALLESSVPFKKLQKHNKEL